MTFDLDWRCGWLLALIWLLNGRDGKICAVGALENGFWLLTFGPSALTLGFDINSVIVKLSMPVLFHTGAVMTISNWSRRTSSLNDAKFTEWPLRVNFLHFTFGTMCLRSFSFSRMAMTSDGLIDGANGDMYIERTMLVLTVTFCSGDFFSLGLATMSAIVSIFGLVPRSAIVFSLLFAI